MKIIMEKPPVEETMIERILTTFDSEFIPPISLRVDLHQYAVKLAKSAVWFLAYENTYIIGHCAVYMNQKNFAYISSLAIKSEMQGNGIGSALWDSLEEEAIKRGIHYITLKASKENKNSIRFYEHHSCKIVSENEGWLTMIKDIMK